MQDISGFGSQIVVQATVTFPIGLPIRSFADDADPLDIPSIDVMDKAMGVNGDLLTWSKANALPVTLNVIPGSDDDINLNILLEANRVGRGKISSQDEITLTCVFPDGQVLQFVTGKIMGGMVGNSISSSGRLKSKTYMFAFENRTLS